MTKERTPEPLPDYLIKNLEQLSKIPNVPYLYIPTRRTLLNDLESIKSESETTLGIKKEIAEDEFALYVRLAAGNPKRRLYIFSHLDHPGFILNSPNEGIPLGSINLEGIQKLIKAGELIPLKVFERNGRFIGVTELVDVKLGTKPRVSTRPNFEFPKNSHGILDVPLFDLQKETIKMIAADNVVCTSLCLFCIKNIKNILEEPKNFKDFDVVFVFTYIEEIKQVSASGIALRKSTPFGKLKKEDIFVALEAMEMTITSKQEAFLKTATLPRPNYEDGVLIKINDSEVIFGQGANGQNLAETLLVTCAKKLGIPFQHTVSSGVSEGTALTLFGDSPNIATIAIPCRNKHNWSESVGITPEEVKIRDIIGGAKLMLEAIKASKGTIGPTGEELVPALLESSLLASPDALKKIRKERLAVLTASLPRLRKAKFFSENLSEEIFFDIYRILGRLRTL